MKKLGGKNAGGEDFKDNGWFVGMVPRRNPEIVVSVLIEKGEHGYIAAEVAQKIVKFYVEKQRKAGVLTAGTPPVKTSAKVEKKNEVEMAAVWTENAPDDDHPGQTHEKLNSGKYHIKLDDKPKMPSREKVLPRQPAHPAKTTEGQD